ncbi:MAG: FtsW/RodA/SpoVE family cell cycle protein [Anaerolineae bacterium]
MPDPHRSAGIPIPAGNPIVAPDPHRSAGIPIPARKLLAFPLLFTCIAFAQLSMLETGGLAVSYFIPVGVLALCLGGAGWALNRWRPFHDRLLLPLIGMLSGLGLAEVARLAPDLSPGYIRLPLPTFLLRQLIWLVLGTLVLLAVVLVPGNLRWLRRYRYTWLFAGLALLALTLIVGVNPSGFGARLWLGAGGIYVQPSELLKLLMLVFLASYLEDRRQVLLEVEARIGRWQLPHPAYLGPMLLMWGFSMLLLIWQRDLGAALLFFGVFLAMLYAATGQGRYVLTGVALLVVAAMVGYRLFDHVALRVDAWWNPWQEASGRSFQIVQSLLAFASGGVLGQGLGQGLPTAIPVVHTDFVFAAIGEEYGLVGALAVILCFALLVGRAFHIALAAQRPFDQLLAAGIGALIGLQSLVIMAGTLKMIPLTGVTLPFVSYGGSSLLTSMIMVGLLLHISARSR